MDYLATNTKKPQNNDVTTCDVPDNCPPDQRGTNVSSGFFSDCLLFFMALITSSKVATAARLTR